MKVRMLARIYVVALGAVAIASLCSYLLSFWEPRAPASILLAAVVFSAWFGGLYPAILAAVLAALTKHLVFFNWESPGFGLDEMLTTGLFLLIAVAVGTLVSRLREQQELLSVTLSSIGDAVITTDASGKVRFLNPVAEHLTGWTTREAAGQPLTVMFRVLHEQTRQAVEDPVQRVLNEGPVAGLDNHAILLSRDGHETPIEHRAAPMRNASGEAIGVVMVFCDITERRQREKDFAKHEQELERERKLLRTLIDNVPDIIFTKDLECRFVISNTAHLRLLGMEDESQVAGKSVFDLHPRELAESYQADDLRVLMAEERLVNREELCLDHSGGEHWHLTTKVPLRDKDGRVIGLVGISRNIDERKKTEQALQRERELLKGIVDHIPVMLWIYDSKRRHFELNCESERLLGWSSAEASEGGFIANLFPEPAHRQQFANCLRSPSRGWREWEVRCKDGSLLPSNWACIGLSADIHLCIGIDLREAKKSAEALRRSGERFKLLAEVSTCLLNAGNPLDVLEELCRSVMRQLDCEYFFNFLAVSSGQRLRLNACAGVSSEDARELEWLDYGVAVCGCAARDREPIIVENVQSTDDSRTSLIKSYGIQAYCCTPLLSQNCLFGTLSFGTRNRRAFAGEEVAVMKSVANQMAVALHRMQSLDALRQAKEELARANEHLESKVQERTARLREIIADLEQFSYSIAHDLRAPLRSMVSFSSLLLDEYGSKLEAEPSDYLRRIAAGARRMDNLVRDVLTYSQVTREDMELAPVNLDALVREILAEYPQFRNEQVQIAIASPLLPVNGNIALLTQCISNLLDNAVKFVAPNSKPQVRVWTEGHNCSVRFCVQDQGIGIEASQLGRVWRIFERCHSPEKFGGTGIGLSIVKRAVERMGGKVGMQSALGEGSTFWFELSKP
jgi:PAS domain S-box-containing protein